METQTTLDLTQDLDNSSSENSPQHGDLTPILNQSEPQQSQRAVPDGNSKSQFNFRLACAVAIVAFLGSYSQKNGMAAENGLPGDECIADFTFDGFRGMNRWFAENLIWRDVLMISNSLCIDLINLYLLMLMFTGVNNCIGVFLGTLCAASGKAFVQNALLGLGRVDGFLYFFPGIYSMTVPYHDVYDFFYSGHTSLAVCVAYFLLAIKNQREHKEAYHGWLFWAWTIGFCPFVYFMITVLFTHYIIDVTAAVCVALILSTQAEKLSFFIDVSILGHRWQDRYMLKHQGCPSCGWANYKALNLIDEEEKRTQAELFMKKTKHANHDRLFSKREQRHECFSQSLSKRVMSALMFKENLKKLN